MSNVQTTSLNGVDIGKLVATIDAIKARPTLADFRFRADTTWRNGGHASTEIQRFYGAGTEDTTRTKAFILEGDEPPVLLGGDAGPNAVEMILAGLGSCLAVGFVYNAAAQGIRIEELSFHMEGDIDLHGFLGLSDEIRPGYQNIRVLCRVQSDAPREKLLALCDHVKKTSPVLDIVRNPVAVSVMLEA